MFWLFIIVAVIAIVAAAAMLLSENAVYSALLLIVNFGCVAVLYLMLDAPFLAMIQIAVYAGAIMVLFLFVIMLLGAEKLSAPTRQFRWIAPLAIGLGVFFLVVTAVYISNGQIDLSATTGRPPMLRVVHAAGYAGNVDVYANGQLVADNVTFGQATDYLEVPAGEYTINLNAAGTDQVAATATIVLEADTTRQANTYSAVAYGGPNSAPQIALLSDNNETTDARTGRVTIFNSLSEPISLVDYGSEGDTTDDRVVQADIQPGQMIELPLIPEETPLRAWHIASGSADAGWTDLYSLDNPDTYSIERDSAQLWVVTTDAVDAEEARTDVMGLKVDAVAAFGGPAAIGQLLFTRYMLPFQLIAVLLLAAMVGAIVLTHKDDFQPRRRDVRRRVMKPLTTVIGDQVGQDVAGEAAPKLPEAAGD
jgi:NADH:ubiquinone oxidoreductase subunit 6 (subunit J)